MTDPNASGQTAPNSQTDAGATAQESAAQPDQASGSQEAQSSAPQWEQPGGQHNGSATGQSNSPPPDPGHGQPYDQQYSQPYEQPYSQPNAQYGQPYAQQYPPTYGQPYAAGPTTNTLAIIALIAAFVFPPAGIVCGHIALGQIKTTGEAGRGLALAGVIIGYVWAALIVLIIVTSFILPLVMFGVFAPAFVGLNGM